MSLVAVETTRAHNMVLPSVPAKAIFFIRCPFQSYNILPVSLIVGNLLNSFSLSNSRRHGQTHFSLLVTDHSLATGRWFLVNADLTLKSLFIKTSSVSP
jgi:hypothetical protein